MDPDRYSGFRVFTLLMGALLFLAASSPAHALTSEEKNHIAIYEATAKGVVNITSTVVTYDFFLRAYPHEGSGSGIVLDKKGHILTNRHVIKNARSLEVTLSDQSRYPGVLVGVYPESDLAVIRIKAPADKLFPIPMGDSSELKVGQKVLAIGNPFGLGTTLTTGVISSVGRTLRSSQGAVMEDLIQTDASINPGNSGGPLLDSEGRLIGINTAILSPSGGSIGIGFAVPVDEAKRAVPDLIEKGYVSYAYIGITVFPVSEDLARLLKLGVDRGLLVVEVDTEGPAHRQGLKGPDRKVRIGNAILPVGGDVIVAVDGRRVDQADLFVRSLRKKRPGETVILKIYREGSYQALPVKLGERPRSR